MAYSLGGPSSLSLGLLLPGIRSTSFVRSSPSPPMSSQVDILKDCFLCSVCAAFHVQIATFMLFREQGRGKHKVGAEVRGRVRPAIRCQPHQSGGRDWRAPLLRRGNGSVVERHEGSIYVAAADSV